MAARRVLVSETVLRQARGVIAGEIAMTLASCCLHDKKTGKPRRETLDEIARPNVERMEASVAALDRALKGEKT